jgi:fructokinase
MSDTTKILGLGECVVDFVPCGDGGMTYQLCPGGGVANVCVAASRLGLESRFIGAVGRDYFGEFLRGVLDGYGVDTTHLKYAAECGTFLAFVHHGPGGESGFSFANQPGADKFLEWDDSFLGALSEADALHVSSNSIAGERTMLTQSRLLKAAQAMGKPVSYDINYREAIHDQLGNFIDILRMPLEAATVVKATGDELEMVTGKRGEEGARALLGDAVKIVLVTEGRRGASYFTSEGGGHVDAPRVVSVDATGSGDAFLGAFLASMLRSGFGEITLSRVDLAARYAARAAALSVTKTGAMAGFPTGEEVENFKS